MPVLIPAHMDHRRIWRHFDYCYPVISRRSRGLSLGINLNLNKVCNFDCVYCEVDRINPPKRKETDLRQLEDEMRFLIQLAVSGELYEEAPFSATNSEQRRFNDLAFSGDGEPTAAVEFSRTVDILVNLCKEFSLTDVKLVLITNATRLQHKNVVSGIDTLMANNGEIWAKLDAGTEEYYRAINRSDISLEQIISNLEFAGKRWPITIQTLFLEWNGKAPSVEELNSYTARLKYLLDSGIKLQKLQLHTVARPTPEIGAKPLPSATIDNIANHIIAELPELPDKSVELFYGPVA